MGHTITQWVDKVEDLIRDAGNRDITAAKVETLAVRPALYQYSVDRPLELITETAGNGTSYYSLPTGWVTRFSRMREVEYPARQNPPEILDDQAYLLARSPTDVTAVRIRLKYDAPSASEYIRWTFTSPFPYPTAVAGDDLVDDIAYEAVTALAASFCCLALLSEAARSRAGAIPSDFTDGRERTENLGRAATRHRAIYDRFLGLTIDPGAVGPKAAPASRRIDMDPAWESLFHGGRR